MGHLCCFPVDSDGTPLRTHILYSDQRSSAQTQALVSKIPPREIFSLTGHRPSPSYSIEKLIWIRDNQPEVYKNTYKILNAKDYINFIFFDEAYQALLPLFFRL
mgnify:CR=1 FL=1